MQRLNELSSSNGDLQEEIEKRKEQNELLMADLENLKEKLKLKGSPSSSVYMPSRNNHKLIIRGVHYRQESQSSMSSV